MFFLITSCFLSSLRATKSSFCSIEVLHHKKRVPSTIKLSRLEKNIEKYSEDGSFTIGYLLPGRYVVEVIAEGFETYTKDLAIREGSNLIKVEMLAKEKSTAILHSFKGDYLYLKNKLKNISLKSCNHAFILDRSMVGDYIAYFMGSSYQLKLFMLNDTLLIDIDGEISDRIAIKPSNISLYILISNNIYESLLGSVASFSVVPSLEERELDCVVDIDESKISIFSKLLLSEKATNFVLKYLIKMGNIDFTLPVRYVYDGTYICSLEKRALSLSKSYFKKSFPILCKNNRLIDLSYERYSIEAEGSYYSKIEDNILYIELYSNNPTFSLKFEMGRAQSISFDQDKIEAILTIPKLSINYHNNYYTIRGAFLDSKKFHLLSTNPINRSGYILLGEIDTRFILREIKDVYSYYVLSSEIRNNKIVSQVLYNLEFCGDNDNFIEPNISINRTYRGRLNLGGKVYLMTSISKLEHLFEKILYEKGYLKAITLALFLNSPMPGASLTIIKGSRGNEIIFPKKSSFKDFGDAIELSTTKIDYTYTKIRKSMRANLKILGHYSPSKILLQNKIIKKHNFDLSQISSDTVTVPKSVTEILYAKEYSFSPIVSSQTFNLIFSYSTSPESLEGKNFYSNFLLSSTGERTLVLSTNKTQNGKLGQIFSQGYMLANSSSNKSAKGSLLGNIVSLFTGGIFSKVASAFNIVIGWASHLNRVNKYVPTNSWLSNFSDYEGKNFSSICSDNIFNYSIMWSCFFYHEISSIPGEIKIFSSQKDSIVVKIKAYDFLQKNLIYSKELKNGDIFPSSFSIGWNYLEIYVYNNSDRKYPWVVDIPFNYRIFRHTAYNLSGYSDEYIEFRE